VTILFEDLKVLQAAEKIGDELWKQIVLWDGFARDTVGKQFARAADSVGANIAEAYGRYHYSEKLQFLYYARGSLFETKYWLNRAHTRQLLVENQATLYAEALSKLAFQLNTFSKALKEQRREANKSPKKIIREPRANYQAAEDAAFVIFETSDTLELFTSEEIDSLRRFPRPLPDN
jgi:four helix bundle protein